MVVGFPKLFAPPGEVVDVYEGDGDGEEVEEETGEGDGDGDETAFLAPNLDCGLEEVVEEGTGEDEGDDTEEVDEVGVEGEDDERRELIAVMSFFFGPKRRGSWSNCSLGKDNN